MARVNICVCTTGKGPSPTEMAGAYEIQLIGVDTKPEMFGGKPVEVISGVLYRQSITSYELTLQLLTNAVYTVKKLGRQWESIEVYLYESIVQSALMNRWVDKWKANDWKNAKGEAVAHCSTWQQLTDIIDSCSDRFIYTNHEYNHHQHLIWLANRKIETERRIRGLKKELEGKEYVR